MTIFTRLRNYSLFEILNICKDKDLIVVDCLKEENMISIEEYNSGGLGDCLFEFNRIGEDTFKLVYIDKLNLQRFWTGRHKNN